MRQKTKNFRRLLRLGLLMAGFLYSFFFFLPEAGAVQIKRVQTGEIYFDADDLTQIAEIDAVDQSKTLVLLYLNADYNTATGSRYAQNYLFTSQFASDTELVLSRDGSGYGATVRYYLIEFAYGVNVLRGVTSFAAGSYTNPKYTTKDILLSPSLDDYTEAFPIVQARSAIASTTTEEIATVMATVVDNNTLRLERYASNDTLRSVNIVWQVAQFSEDASLRSGTASIVYGGSSATATISPVIPTGKLNKCFLFFTYKGGRGIDGVEGNYKIRGAITNENTVTFYRGATGSTDDYVDISWYVIELTDPVSSMQGQGTTITVPSGTLDALMNLNPAVDPTRSCPVFSVSGPANTTNTYNKEVEFSVERDSPRGIVYDPGNNYIWVTNYHSDTVTRYNASTGAQVGSPISVGSNPIAIAYCPNTSPASIWVANYSSNNVTRINANNGTVAATVTVNAKPIDIAVDLSSSPNSVWTANNGQTSSTGVVTRINTSTNSGTAYNGYAGYPTSICYDADGPYIWLGYATSDYITRFPIAGGSGTSYDLGATNQYYSAMTYAPSGFGGYGSPALWVTSLRNNFVVRVTLTAAHAYSSRVEFGTELNPRGITTVGSGASGRIAFTNASSNTMSITNPNDGTSIAYATDANPWGIAYDSANSKLWVANSSSRSFMKFNIDGSDPVVYSQGTTVDKLYFKRNNATTANDVSINWFMPQFCPITLVEPNGPETWGVGENQTIRWKYADCLSGHTVKLQITSNGSDWYDIPGATSLDIDNDSVIANEGKFVWNNLPASITGISNIIGTTLKVRLWDTTMEASPANYYDLSNADFKIKGKLTVDTPPAIEPNIWKLGESHNITWSTKGNLNSLTPDDMTICLATDGTNFNHTLTAVADPGTDGTTNNPWAWNNIPSQIERDAEPGVFDNTIGTNNKIKLKLNYTVAGTVESISDAFVLKGRIFNARVTDAGGSPVSDCLVGATYYVRWDKKGQFGGGANEGTVDIYYSSNSGASFSTALANGQPSGTDAAGGSWTWNIPADFPKTPGGFDSCVRVIQTNDTTVSGDSGDFQVKSGSVLVNAPDGGETWNVGEPQNISWSASSNLGNVKIWLSRNNGGTWALLTEVAANSPPYPWTVEPPLTTEALVKIESSQYVDLNDVSDGTFSIGGAIDVTSPISTDFWEIGDSQTISWDLTGIFSTVDIYVSRNSGGTWGVPIITGHPAGTGSGSYLWTVAAPGTPNPTAKVKVESQDFASQTISGESELFTIRETIHVDVPNSTGIIWRVGTSQNIQWTISGSLPGNKVDIFYKKGVAGSYTLITPAEGVNADSGGGTGSWSWSSIPNDIHSEVYIKVQDHGRSYIYDVGDVAFQIKGSINLSQPQLNEVVKVSDTAETKTIQWNLTGNVVGTAEIRLSTNGGTSYDILLTENTVNIATGNYPWTVLPGHMGMDNKIKVALDGDEDLTTGTAGTSATFFVKPQVKLTYPNQTGIVKSIGELMTITWNALPDDFGGAGKVNLRYSTNGAAGPYDGTIISNIDSNLQTYDWTILDVPGMVSPTVRVKVYKNDDEVDVHAESSYDFTVKGNITITGAANGAGSPWEAGIAKNITWNKTGDLGTVKIMFSKSSTPDYTYTIVTGVDDDAGASGYPWNLPDALFTTLDFERTVYGKIKIASEIDTSIADESDDFFTLQSRLNLTQPIGGEVLEAEQAGGYDISWNSYGKIPQVKLAYDTDSGNNNYDNPINGGNPISNVNAYNWTVPIAIGNKFRVKVMSYNNPDYIYTASPADFKIKGRITIIAPTSATKDANAWKVDNTAAGLPGSGLIQWTNYGNLGGSDGYLTIKYASNGVDFSATLTATAASANGPQSFNWTIPNNIGTTNKIKISDDDNTDPALNISKESEAFEIKGQLLGTSPLNGEVYYIGGSPIGIEWKYAGTLGNIDLFFSSDDGVNWGGAFATVNVGYTQPYQYTVPDLPTTQGKIKLEQVSDRTYVNSIMPNDGAPNHFRIKGTVTISPTHNPTSSTIWTVNADNNVIEWDITGSIATVAIDLDTHSGDNGYNIAVVSSVTATNRTYTWIIPTEKYVEVTSELCRVRVRDTTDSTVSDTSPADFKIKPVINITAPINNTYQWVAGTRYNITWDPPLGSADAFKLNVSTDGGTTWTDTSPPTLAAKGGLVTSSMASAAGGFEWLVPDIMTNEGVIRIQKVGDTSVNDYSNSYFYIKGSLANVHIKNNPEDADPVTPIDLPIGYVKYITWNYTGSLGTVDLYYAIDGDQPDPTWVAIPGGSNVSVGSDGKGSFAWTIPNIPSPNVKVKVANVYNPSWQNVSGTNAYLNSIVGSVTEVTVVSDAQGTNMIIGGNKTIRWKPNGNISLFKLEYRYDNGPWTEISPAGGVAGAVAGDYRTWQWTGNPPGSGIPDTISNNVDFRVSDYNDPIKVNAESTQDYIIKGSLNLTDPDGYETLTVAEAFNITWNNTGSIGNLLIEYSTDDFNSDIRTIHPGWPSTNSPYPWSPGINDITNQDNLKVRVTNITTITGTEVTDKSVNPFKIIGKIYNVQPSGSSFIWYKGQTKNATWEQAGNISAVDIKYKTLAGDLYNKVLALNHTGHTDGSNSAEVTVPDENSEDCWVQVSDKNNADVKGASAAAFSIRPVITVSKPVLDTNILVGSSNTDAVEWSLNGSAKVSTVDVFYSTNGVGGPFDKTIASGVDATLGKANWNNISDTMSNDVLVKVVDKTGGTGNPNVFGLSPNFDIIGGITMTGANTPNSTSNWQAGTTDKYITWSHAGSLGDINIRYKYSGGAYSTPINAVPIAVTVHSYNWPSIPSTISENVQVKIESVNNPDEEFIESPLFKIRGGFTALTPLTTTALIAGTSYEITWNNLGLQAQIPTAKLEFFDGTNWHNIDYKTTDTGLVDNTGSYPWSIPTDVKHTACKFRISDPDNSEATADSTTFEIRAKIDVTDPVSTDEWTQGTTENINWNVTGVVANVKIEYSKNGGTDWIEVIASRPAADKPYPWPIPTTGDLRTPDQAKVRVSDAGYGVVLGNSPDFRMKGAITVTNPIGTDILKVGDVFNIKWTTTGFLSGNVVIGYSITGGAPFTAIDTVAYNYGTPAGTYPWIPPIDSITSNLKNAVIEIKDANDPAKVRDESDLFEIEGKIRIDAPDTSGLIWTVGSVQQIKWTPTGTYTPVEIQYSLDGFTTPRPAATVTNSASGVQGSYDWTIPDDISDTVRVRVRDDNDDNVQDTSSFDLKIVGSLDVISPETTGIVWNVGETGKVISWTATGTVTNIKIEYKTSLAGGYTTIVANDGNHTAGGNSYIWTSAVPDENSEDCYIKVSDALHPNDVFNVSTVAFSIRPVITITAPSLGQNIEVGSLNNAITWNVNSSKVGKVDIYYSENGLAGPFDKLISNGIICAQGNNSYTTWGPIADDISSDVVIKVRDKSNDVINNNVYGLSGSFDIVGKITASEPHNGENLGAGGSKTIVWTKNGTLGNVKLYYFHDGSYEYINTVDSNTFSSYNWSPIPTQIENNSTVKVIDEDTEGTEDEIKGISGQFNIIGQFVLTEPPVNLNSGAAYSIEWNNFNLQGEIPNAKLEFFDGTAWHNIDYKTTDTGIVPNSGSYSWTVPTDVRHTACQFKISDPNNVTAFDTSNTFEVRPIIDVTAPTAADKWTIGSSGNQIVWSITGPVSTVKIEYSKDSGTNYTYTITPSVLGNSSPYLWTLPTGQDIIPSGTDKSRIRILDTSLAAIYDASSLFMVQGSITVTSPNASSPALKVGEVNNIVWTTPCTDSADMGNVKIEFRKSNTEIWTEIATLAFNAIPYTLWAPPIDSITNNAKTAEFKISDVDNAEVFDVSDGFEIEGKITLDAPIESNLKWRVNSTYQIKWTPQGTYSPIKLEYSTNGFSDELQTVLIDEVSNSAHNTQRTFDWAVPDAVGNNVKVRVSYKNDPDIKAVCPNPITVLGNITDIVPNGGQIWYKDESRTISWYSNGTITDVKIEYKISAAGALNLIVADHPGHTTGANSYQWTSVADENSQDCYIRVSDADPLRYPDVYGVSAASFSIRPKITITAPVQDQNILVGTNNNTISWSLNGSTKVQYVKLYYSKDNGPFTNVINDTGTVDATQPYTWNGVPDDISDNIKIRVIDAGNSNVYADSPSFDIIGSVTVQQPNSTANWPVGATDKNIAWTYTGSIGTVNIYYDYGAGYGDALATGIPAANQTWNWPSIPDTVSNNVKVKVGSLNNPSEEFDESDVFKIRGSFNFVDPGPADGEVLTAGTSYTIQWTKVGTNIPQVKLEFSTNGITYNPIATVDNTGEYGWLVYGTTNSKACKLRISDPNNEADTRATSAAFEVRALLDVTQPTSAAKWTIGTTNNNIAWAVTGVVVNVKIDYSKDGGADSYAYNIVPSRDSTQNPYPWTIPTDQDILSTNQAKIKISDASYAVVYDTSPDFMLKSGIAVTSPDTSTIGGIGDPFSISWTTLGTANMGDLNIYFSKTGGPVWGAPITTVAYNSGIYSGFSLPIDSITNNAKTAKIKIEDIDNTEVFDESDAFEIEGKIALDSPDIDAPTWYVGDIRQIKWTPTGSFGYVKIEYSTNGFSDELQTIVEVPTFANSPHNTQATYDWTIPNKIGSNLKVRVSGINDPDTKDISASPFIIKGKIILSEPNGGETWYVADATRKIKWQSTGSINTVRIEYSKNNGGEYTQIIADAPAGAGAGEYTWPSVADAISEQCLIRISDTNDASVNDVSNSVFFIKGKIQILSPDGSQRWVAQSSNHPITWDITGSIQNVQITYSVDDGPFTNQIVASTNAANETYTWNNLPNHVSNSYKIKIADLNDPDDVFAISNPFKIVGSITVTEPSGGEQLKVGNNFKVEWTKIGDFVNARVEYSINGGINYDYQIVDSVASDNLFYWWNNISQNTVSSNVVLKITDVSDIQTFDASEPFKIQGMFNITSPDGGEVWAVGSEQSITWNTTGNITNVKLEYSIDGGNSWVDPPIAANISNTGSRSWTIPDSISDLVRVRISDVNDPDAKDMSADNFKIRGDLKITSPNTGTESWLVGSTQPITWDLTGSIDAVKLEFSVDGAAYEPIPGADNLAASLETFNWQIPDRISSQVKIKITNKDDTTVYDESDNNFTLTGKLDLTSPAGGESWFVQDQNTISWTKTGTIPTVKLEYSVAGGAYQQIQDAESLSGNSFNWIIPDALSTQVKVRVSNTNALKPTIPGVSGLFTIKGKLQLTNPLLNDIWDVNQEKNITWIRTGSIATVKLEYNHGSGFIPIPGAGNIDAGLQSFSWTIPNTISSNVVVRITNNADNTVTDDSDAFRIAADINLTSPVGAEVWIVDEQRPITWEKYGDIDNIIIKYDINEGLGGYPNTIATCAASGGSYTWQVPDQIGNKLRVRIEDANTSSYTQPDACGANFAIRGSITITNPAGLGVNKKIWLCESSQTIDYTIHGSIANVEIRYSLDGGSNYPENKIIASSVAVGAVPQGGKNLVYPWTVPVDTSTHTVVKITNLASVNVYDESDEFTMRGGFAFIHPISGERWLATSPKLIEWNTFGIINYVYLQYSLNNGSNWFFVNDGSPIANTTQNYNWTVPNVITSQALMKITDTNDPASTTTSESFVINGTLTLTQPNGQEKLKVGQSDASTKIKWTMVGPISGVDLALSSNGQAGTYTTFAANQQASLLEYQWSVPTNIISNNCFIRIRYTQDALVEDFSDLAFKIMENFSLISPNGSEKWIVGTAQNIVWSTVSSPNQTNNVILKYSIQPPYTAWDTIVAQTQNDGAYQWTIPQSISNTCRVRVSDYNEDTDAYDISDADFKIQGSIALTAPLGGEKWGCASQQWIRWTWQGNIAKVDIHYYNGSTWVAIDEAQGLTNGGEYEWTIPIISTTQARVRVRDNNDPTDVYDISPNPFKIMGRVTVQVPNGTEVWYAGSNATIAWAKYGPASFDTVKIDYSVDDPDFNSPQSITTSTPNDSSFDWLNIPAEAVSGAVRVRIAKPDDPDVSDISDGDFRVRAQFTINTPAGGQKWTVGNNYTINWSQIGNTQGAKFIYYRQTNPAINQTFTLPSNYTTGTWNYNWTIPDFIYNDLLMRIEDPDDNGAFDLSEATFKIMPGFTVTLPNGNSANEADYKWYVGDPATIHWTYAGTVSDVGIYYSTTGGIEGSWLPLTSVPASDLEWIWLSVPDQITAQLKIKVASATDSDAYGLSQGMSKIRAKFDLSAPAGSEELVVGDTFRISWTNTGTVSKIDLHYSKDDFTTPIAVQNGININNIGYFDWTIPDDIFQNVKVRVKSNVDNDAYDISDELRIKGNIWVNAPVAGPSWEIGRNYDIKWGWVGTIPQVKIIYSINGAGGPFNPILENYSIANDGIVANGSGSGGPASEYTYSWLIPDEATGDAVIRIADARTSESDVVDTSDGFSLVGYITVKAPNAVGAKLAVDSAYNITWEWGGTMPEVKITYSANGDAGPFNPIQENYGTANDGIVANGSGSGGSGSEYTYLWTVPDAISTNCKVKIADARPGLEETVFDVSDNAFKIQGALTLITPLIELNDNETPANPADDFYECRWVTNEVRQIQWTTFGTINNVDLVYAKDFDSDGDIDASDFADEIPMAGGTNIANQDTFNWTIPNERLITSPYYVNAKVRIYDHNDHEVYVEGPTPVGSVDTLKIDYYKITWDIRDLITNQPIQGLKVNDTSGWIGQGLSSPVIHYVPAGYWTAEWSHTDFGAISEPYLVGWDADAYMWRKDRAIYRTMETLVVHIWRAYSEFSYDVPADKLDITTWLERDGNLVPGALIIDVNIYDGIYRVKRKTTLVDQAANMHYYYSDVPSDTKLWIGDRMGETRTMQDVINDCAPYKVGEAPIPSNFSGFFQQSWNPTNYTAGSNNYDTLEKGKVYTVASYIAIATGANFTTPVSFTVTIPTAMEEMKEQVAGMVGTVNSVLDKPISVVSAEIQSTLEEQTQLVETKLTEQTNIIQSATDEIKTTIETAMTSFEQGVQESLVTLQSGAEQAVAAGMALEATAKKYSWKAMVSPDPGLTGDKITLTCQGPPLLSPMLDIYSWDNRSIVNDIILIDTTGEGVYNYEFEADTRFTAGKAYTYVITEQTTSGMVSGSGMVESTGISAVAGLAAAAPEAERAAKKALEAIKAVEAVVISGENINIALTLKNLKESVEALPETFSREGPSAKVTQVMSEISDRVKKLAGDEGYDMGTLLEKTLSSSPTVRDIRVKTDEIRGTVDALGHVIESRFGGIDAPIVLTTINPGSVRFRIVAINPSKTKAQNTQIKYYLPIEVKPRDVSDTAGLDLEYDSEKSIYYAYKPELELLPAEVRVFEVEVEDVWIVPKNKLADLRNRTDRLLAKLDKTQYYLKAKEIADTIYPRLDEIAASQADESVSREQHIGIYRQNLLTVAQIKEDIARMEKILVTAGGPAAPEMLAETKIKAEEPTKTMTWIVIFIIIIFVGLLAAVLFFTWHHQARITKEELLTAKKSAFPESNPKGQEHKEN